VFNPQEAMPRRKTGSLIMLFCSTIVMDVAGGGYNTTSADDIQKPGAAYHVYSVFSSILKGGALVYLLSSDGGSSAILMLVLPSFPFLLQSEVSGTRRSARLTSTHGDKSKSYSISNKTLAKRMDHSEPAEEQTILSI
jgi:hypothetical protein